MSNYKDKYHRTKEKVRDYKQAVQAGGEDYRPPEECPGDYAFVKDPEGYEVEILARPAATPEE